jgi:23S rRNA (cytosine1962-C5)-methyltransferase
MVKDQTESVILKKGRERSLQNRHPWIFSGAIERLPEFEDGAILRVKSAGGELLGSGYFNRRSSIIGRMIAWGDADPLTSVRQNFMNALAFRGGVFDEARTNAYRLINGEGDGIPGLIVDRYADLIVLQVGTLGIERLKNIILEEISTRVKPKAIYEKSLLPSRKDEGLEEFAGALRGEIPSEVSVRENGLLFSVSPEHSQKTGLFLDQREMRSLVGNIARNRSVLNCFSYTGGFSVYAAAGGAASVTSVDISKDAIEGAKRNFSLNGLENIKHTAVSADVFEYLRSVTEEFDLIILDPPAFAKRKDHINQAAKGYNDINRVAMQKIKKGGILVTCSCSHFMEPALFQKIIFSAARDAGKFARIVDRHHQAWDHPISVFHPEGEYLKSLVVQVG